ncbi:MAG: aldehyde ferredoxin oxidoreductase N-terminal domain-containing protein, partial [Faecalibacterium prausnitzii]|nr:aldehyde ferredoxin oxidoreductase N-terminal domain-containing protein [Faecalibacterium prausnitzii]
MAESYGWAGKILRVNLTTGEITTQDDEKYHKYIGGMGMAYRIMYEEAPMELDPYDEKALVIFGVGPLTGAGVPCSGRMNVTFRSTWSKGHSIIDAHMGGHIGSMLKYAGYDGIVISGISEKPVYLRIEDGAVSLEDATEIWGKGTFAANKWMVEQNGREFETASIGPAGENLVDYSTLNTSFGNSGGAGLGAAMGNKKLKGLAIRGTGSVKVADPKKVLELSNYMMGNLIGGNNNHNVPAQPQSWAEYSATSGKNRWSGAPGRMWKKAPGGPVDTGEQPYNDINKVALRCFKGYFDFGAPAAEYTVKNGGCSSCPIRCYTEYDVDPLADYDLPTHNSNTCMPVLYGTRVYPDGVHDFKYEGDGTMVINLAWSHAVDDMGLWDNYGNLNRDLLWILRMPREEATKYISEAEYDSLPWEWEKAGDPRWEVELIRRMAYGEGDLSVIAKGTLAMMEKFGLPKSWLDRDDGATNSNLIYNGFPNH